VIIAISIGLAAWPALSRSGLSFLTESTWDVAAGKFGAAPAIYGTVVSSALALIIATPLALGQWDFWSIFSPRFPASCTDYGESSC
jgi:phosphate transport system permease protein